VEEKIKENRSIPLMLLFPCFQDPEYSAREFDNLITGTRERVAM
jgi:hypothetical protein